MNLLELYVTDSLIHIESIKSEASLSAKPTAAKLSELNTNQRCASLSFKYRFQLISALLAATGISAYNRTFTDGSAKPSSVYIT